MLTSRRQFLKWGTAIGISATLLELTTQASYSRSLVKIPPQEKNNSFSDIPYDPLKVLRDFDYGILKKENGRMIREFEVFARHTTLQLNSAINFVSWNLNDRIPGPTLRAKEGDRIRVIFHNEEGHSHSMHFHGTHPIEMDGIQPVRFGNTKVYEFDAQPYGIHPYHCHIAPVTRHIGKGLYGLLIIDPPQPRPPADEIVLVMGAYDLDDDGKNELYAFNGIPNYYRDFPISIYQNQLIRVYLLGVAELRYDFLIRRSRRDPQSGANYWKSKNDEMSRVWFYSH